MTRPDSNPSTKRRSCAECGRVERPWRRMMWSPFDGTSAGTFICSNRCWDRMDARKLIEREA